MTKCDWGVCQTDATHTITAAYSAEAECAHPLFATYPAPMYRACRTHLGTLIQHDSLTPGATPAYLVRVIA